MIVFCLFFFLRLVLFIPAERKKKEKQKIGGTWQLNKLNLLAWI